MFALDILSGQIATLENRSATASVCPSSIHVEHSCVSAGIQNLPREVAIRPENLDLASGAYNTTIIVNDKV